MGVQLRGEGGWLHLWGHHEVSYVSFHGTSSTYQYRRTEDPWRRCESWHAAQRLAASYTARGAALTSCIVPNSTDQSAGALALRPVSRRGSRTGPDYLWYVARSLGSRPVPLSQNLDWYHVGGGGTPGQLVTVAGCLSPLLLGRRELVPMLPPSEFPHLLHSWIQCAKTRSLVSTPNGTVGS